MMDVTKAPSPNQVGLMHWLVSISMTCLITLSGVAMAEQWSGHSAWRFVLVAILGGLISTLIARSHLLDGFAITLSLSSGLMVCGIITALTTEHLSGSWKSRIASVAEPVVSALFRNDSSSQSREMAAEYLLCLTIWLTSWIAIWSLIRIGSVVLAIIAPCALILVTQQLADTENAGVIIYMIMLAIFLLVLVRIENRESFWRAKKRLISDNLVTRSIVVALVFSMVTSTLAFLSPAAWTKTVLEPTVASIMTRADAIRDQSGAELKWWGRDQPGQATSDYTEFSDEFAIGGPLSLTEDPEVFVEVSGTSAPYLTARSYDFYSGRGWSSTANDREDASAGERNSPELRYNANWEVALSQEARNQRQPIEVAVTPLRNQPNVLLTVDSYLTADVQTVVRMGWIDVNDQPYLVSVETLNQLPPDVQLLGNLLLQSELSGPPTDLGPTATSASLQSAIEEEIANLTNRGITVRWQATESGIIETLFVTGRLPVFDDVEGVFATTPVGTKYSVTGLESIASPESLDAAGTDYPDWVVSRYLQTSDSVTDRTVSLTQEIVGGETNPYRQAVLIEAWLRNNIVYDDQVAAPPDGQDLVDYVLFDNRHGYCEHYSAAMTVMLRSLGVPARVVVGYSPGEYDASSGGFVYRQQNAHAWVEVYFPGFGWIPFEPTANRPLGEFVIDQGSDNSDTSDTPTSPEPTTEPTSNISTPVVGNDNSQATPAPTPDLGSGTPLQINQVDRDNDRKLHWSILAGIAVTAICAASVWLAWSWRLRGLAPAAALMRRLQRVGQWLGVRRSEAMTGREYARHLGAKAEILSVPAKRITRAYEIETFGPGGIREQLLKDAKSAWHEVKVLLLRLWRIRKG